MLCPKCLRETIFIFEHDQELDLTEIYCNLCLWHLTPNQVKHFNYHNQPELEYIKFKGVDSYEKIESFDLLEIYTPGTITGSYIGYHLTENFTIDRKRFFNESNESYLKLAAG